MARVNKIMPREGVGVTLGAQVGHVVTYIDSPEGSLINIVFIKKCQKRSKKGEPPVFDRKIHCSTYLGSLYLSMSSKMAIVLR